MNSPAATAGRTGLCCGLDISMGTSGQGEREDPIQSRTEACVRFIGFWLDLNCLRPSNSHRCAAPDEREPPSAVKRDVAFTFQLEPSVKLDYPNLPKIR